MTRPSKRELERAVAEIGSGDTVDRDPLNVVIRRDRVDENGDVVERNAREVQI